jgi:hypothetical protein
LVADGGCRNGRQGNPGRCHHWVFGILPGQPVRVKERTIGVVVRLLGRDFGRSLRDERSTPGDLRFSSPLVPRAFQGHLARLLPTRQFARHVRVLTGWIVDTRRDSLLPLVFASSLGSDTPGAGDQPTHDRPLVSPLYPHRSTCGRDGITDSVDGKITQIRPILGGICIMTLDW